MLRPAYAQLERIRVLQAAGNLPGTLAVAPAAQARLVQATAQVRRASAGYEHQARTSLSRAAAGSAAVILILFSGFGLFYRRSWILLGKNKDLLSTSRMMRSRRRPCR